MLSSHFFAPKSKRRQKGATLVEFAFWSILAIGITVGAVALFSGAQTTSKEANAFTELQTISGAARSLYSGQQAYTGISASDLVVAKSVTNKYLNAAGTGLVHPFGDAVTLAAASYGTGTDNGFDVVFANLPPEACIRLSTKDLGQSYVSVKIAATSYATLPVSLANATTSCGVAAKSVTWTFK